MDQRRYSIDGQRIWRTDFTWRAIGIRSESVSSECGRAARQRCHRTRHGLDARPSLCSTQWRMGWRLTRQWQCNPSDCHGPPVCRRSRGRLSWWGLHEDGHVDRQFWFDTVPPSHTKRVRTLRRPPTEVTDARPARNLSGSLVDTYLLRSEVNPYGQFAVDGVVAFELRGEGPFVQGDDAGDGQLPVFRRLQHHHRHQRLF